MADPSSISPEGHRETEPQTSRLQAFLRKARGQIEKPPNRNLVESDTVIVPADGKGAGSDSGSTSGYSDTHKYDDQGGGAFAKGAFTKHYAPIAAHEGRHRWDPLAQWTPEEEKKLVRRVSITGGQPITGSILISHSSTGRSALSPASCR